LDGAPYTAVRYGINGSATEGETLSYNGKGGYVYSVAAEGDGEAVTYNGRSESTGFSYGGTEVYTFASEGITFEYVFITVSGKVYFIMRDTERGAQYENGDTMLILDGYGLYSTYVAEDGTEYSGAYLIEEENVVLMESGSEKYRFDLSDNGFTLRGKEYGSYLLRDNFEYKYLVRLNGYGKLSVYSLDDTENPVDGDGDYYVNGEFITLVFNEGITEKTFEGKFTVGAIGGNVYNVFAVSHSVSVSTFVSPEDWTVLVLDDIGNAVSYDKKGRKQNGTYIFITENMLYFVNDAENEACIYNYDLQTGIAYPSVFKERGYFTSSSSLDSLLFSKYGFAMFDGERLYYNVVDDNVIIYRRNVSDPSANEYGFVAENFGPFTATKNFNEKTYYASDGFAIEFTRKTESASKYPVKIQGSDELIPLEKLSFSPNGNDTYRVAGTIVAGGESYPCYVNRAQRENGTYYLYVTNGNLRFDITVEYHGMNEDGDFTDCVYEINSMSSSVTYQAYRYLYYYYYYNYFGMTLQNSFGVLTESRNFNEDGEVSASYLSGSFYTDSGIYDARGSLISFETDDYGAYGAGDIVKAVFTADDGFEYNLYYTVQMHPYLRSYGYLIYAVTRTERLTAEDGYTFIAERIVASDYNLSQGLYFSVSLEKDGEEIPFSNLVRLRNEYYYISRTTDEDGKYVSTAYYRLDFVEDIPEELGENVSLMPAYKSVTVTKESVDMYITEDGTGFAEFKEDTLIILCFNGTEYFSSETVKDEDSGVYTVITTSGDVFTLKIDNGKAVIEKAEDEDGEDQTA
ncbi:MAG: hypothetical protein IJU84_06610, partial [Clostridia bacterium]|nr:hypothetical protein [Clostridia bacterium]